MPMDVAAAKNQYLTTVATILSQGAVTDPAALKAAAEEAAKGIVQSAAGVTVNDLWEALPASWRDSPSSSDTRSQTNAFLQVAGPVLRVEMGAVQPLATRGLASAKEMEQNIAINRAKLAKEAPNTPALAAAVDLIGGDARTAMAQLEAALGDKLLLERIGGPKHKHLVSPELARELAGRIGFARGEVPTAAVFAGGVEVVGPNVHARELARPFGTFFSLSSPISAGLLAEALVALNAVRKSFDEVEMRSAILGRDVQLVSGRVVTSEAFPLHLAFSADGKVGLGLALDLDKLRAYQQTDLDDGALTKSVGGLLRNTMNALLDEMQNGKPLAMALG